VLGTIAIAWLLIIAFRASWQGWKATEPEWRPIFLGALLALVAIVVHGLVDVPYFKNDLSLEFWAIVGLVAAGQGWAVQNRRGSLSRAAQTLKPGLR
jgi:hypothetical protein